ncbi:MAG: hypothetical protein CV087_16935 [Candidatus Brocadia sp. WS118]|nr:MAG: hypothetical protein CV087_16935 [Candidatus Brocadia sp. WS118]
MKNAGKIFIYVSLAFLIYYLYKKNFLQYPTVSSLTILSFSIVFLIIGFLFSVLQWQALLLLNGCQLCIKKSLISFGLTIFGKYIPGKLWMIVGRATYVAQATKFSISQLSLISLQSQFVTLWAGLLLGIIGVLLMGGKISWGWIIFLLWTCLSFVTFSKYLNTLTANTLSAILKKKIVIPFLSFFQIAKILPLFFITWISWIVGFYLLVVSIAPENPGLIVGFIFPLASCLGILAIIAPGGLGIREGVITSFLSMSGMSLEVSVMISAVQRMWFLFGESTFFLIGFLLNDFRLSLSLKHE